MRWVGGWLEDPTNCGGAETQWFTASVSRSASTDHSLADGTVSRLNSKQSFMPIDPRWGTDGLVYNPKSVWRRGVFTSGLTPADVGHRGQTQPDYSTCFFNLDG